MRVWMTPASSLHPAPAGYPEIPERLEWAAAACREAGLLPEPVAEASLSSVDFAGSLNAVHLDGRIQRLQEAVISGRARIDTPECPVAPTTPEAALAAVQSTLFALETVLDGGSAFALVRPPGHHATPAAAMGFCYINNIAVAARQAQRLGRLRVAIVDFDVHHGNGTQDAFYEDDSVFFCSLHEDPRVQYPGTGFRHERGAGAGIGYTMNLTFPTGTEGPAYLGELEGIALPALEIFAPEILLLSAGFDAHRDDPIGGLELAGADYRRIGKLLGELTRRRAIPAVCVLEGGYDARCFLDGLRPFLDGWRESGAE
jgi:acetoin utilization deacetylase AcuC-like enzyme